ncbi:MAG: class B sortase [Clostridiales bacterium]|jgi:sortase B|nr:class B sortase [Clostridiales bacterium]
MIVKHRKFTEDDFDLDEHRIQQERFVWFNGISKRSKVIVGILRIVIALLAFAIAVLIYKAASIQLGIWENNRINEAARLINAGEAQDEFEQDGRAQSATGNKYAPEADHDETHSVSPDATPGDVDPQLQMDDTSTNDEIINYNPIDHETLTADATPAILRLRDEFANEEIVGYIKIDGTAIDFPIAQGTDNEFYLTHNLKRESSSTGAAFLDFENKLTLTDPNTIIYAHNMRDGSMFAELKNYRRQSFYHDHNTISLTLGNVSSSWLIFAYYETSVDFAYNQARFARQQDYESMLNEIKTRALYDTGIDIYSDNQILTLSTCAANDTRRVVGALLMKKS